MELHSNDMEVAELKNFLVGSLSDLRMEIADTDNPAYRRELRERQEVLETVEAKLSEARGS